MKIDIIKSIKNGEFDKGEKLQIHNPKHIQEASTFLKIIDSERIRLSWYSYGKEKAKENLYYLDDTKESKRIRSDTNVNWKKPVFDVSLGNSALIIYG